MDTQTEGEISIAVVGRGRVGKSLLIEKITNQQLEDDSRVNNSKSKPLNKRVRLISSRPEVTFKIASIENELVKPEETTKKCLMAISESNFTIAVLDARFQLSSNQ